MEISRSANDCVGVVARVKPAASASWLRILVGVVPGGEGGAEELPSRAVEFSQSSNDGVGAGVIACAETAILVLTNAGAAFRPSRP